MLVNRSVLTKTYPGIAGEILVVTVVTVHFTAASVKSILFSNSVKYAHSCRVNPNIMHLYLRTEQGLNIMQH